ncbi:hypothetical protein GQX74_014461 [Glossina fuscipes]|uniref:Uncharacterized protein n=1 Tax=Glossina palpalis gambiensis TaxID=67801 RepID=A0A1B0ATZ1_9MUSC|nr:hypothetical protein GQX74_014461 [Glossina fuscipes]
MYQSSGSGSQQYPSAYYPMSAQPPNPHGHHQATPAHPSVVIITPPPHHSSTHHHSPHHHFRHHHHSRHHHH